ncbi:MAG: hypothetical protein K8R37_07855 [Bacteroidales bacterium]|nr:hypothetical protein [Bacteroidales bacterium]
MITLSLNKNSEKAFNKLLSFFNGDQDKLFSDIYNYKILELKKGIKNIELDLKKFEKRYSMSTKVFYEKLSDGQLDDNCTDFIEWSGEYEILLELIDELKQLQ